jgi:hypothetical protein
VGLFETEMDFTIAALLAATRSEQRMFHRFGQRIAQWRKLAREFYTDDEVFAGLNHLIDDARDMHTNRCIILHGRMYGDPKGRTTDIYVDTHQHLERWTSQVRRLPLPFLREGAELIRGLSVGLLEFNRAHLPATPRALPRRYP